MACIQDRNRVYWWWDIAISHHHNQSSPPHPYPDVHIGKNIPTMNKSWINLSRLKRQEGKTTQVRVELRHCVCPGKSFSFPMPQFPQLWNRDDSPSLLHRGIVRPSPLTFAKLLQNPLTEVAAQHEHKVVVFGGWFFFETLKRWAIERVSNIVHCLFRNAWWNPSQQGKRVCKRDEKRADAKPSERVLAQGRRKHPSLLTLVWWGEKEKRNREKEEKRMEEKKREKERGREQQSNVVGITLLTVACPTTALADHKTASHIHVVFAARRQGTKHTTSRQAL